MKYTYTQLAKMIDHSLLHPALSDNELEEGCAIASKYQVASVCVKPFHVKRAAELLRGTGVLVGAVVGFPHGNSTSEVKRYETEIACRDGADEIDMVINIGKAISGDWDYVEREIRVVCDEAHGRGAIVKVIFENDFLPDDCMKIQLCRVCEKSGSDYVKTSTGYGFVKQPDGSYKSKGATEHDLKLMREHCSPKLKVKAAGGVRDLDALIQVRDLGAERCGASATVSMLDEYKKRAAGDELKSEKEATTLGTGGY